MRRSTTFATILSSLLLYTISYFLLSSNTFFVSDTGLRFLQIQQLLEHNFRSFAIPYSGYFLDQEFRHVPYYYAYGIIDEHLYLEISPFFPYLTAILYQWFGDAGLPVLPVLGSMLSGIAVWALAELSGVKRTRLTFLLSILATPLLFYALVLWDHSIALAVGLWGMYAVARGVTYHRTVPIVLGGSMVGVSTTLRPEMHVFAIALGVSLTILVWPKWKSVVALAAGGLVGVLPLWFVQYIWVGHPLGMATAANLFDYAQPDIVVFSLPPTGWKWAVRLSNYLLSVPAQSPVALLGGMLIIGGAIILVFALRRQHLMTRRNLAIAAGSMVAGYLLYAAVAWHHSISGILSTFPLFPFALVLLNERHTSPLGKFRIYKLIFFTLSIFLALMVVLWPAPGGRQWGARYLLPSYPLMLLLAIYVYEVYGERLSGPLRQTLSHVFISLVIMSVLLQGLSVRVLYKEHRAQMEVRDTLRSLPPEVILTNSPYLASYMSSLRDKVFVYVQDGEDLRFVLRNVVQEDIPVVAIVPLDAVSLDIPQQVSGHRLYEVEPFVYTLEE